MQLSNTDETLYDFSHTLSYIFDVVMHVSCMYKNTHTTWRVHVFVYPTMNSNDSSPADYSSYQVESLDFALLRHYLEMRFSNKVHGW